LKLQRVSPIQKLLSVDFKKQAISWFLLLVYGVLSFSFTPTTLHSLREQEFRSVYETYNKTDILLARPGPIFNSENPFAELPDKEPIRNQNLGPGAVGDDPGFYLITSYVGRFLGINDPMLALRFAFALCAVASLYALLTSVRRNLSKTRNQLAVIGTVLLLTISHGLWSPLGTNSAASEGSIKVGAPYIFGSVFLFSFLICVLQLVTKRDEGKKLLILATGLSGYLAFLCRASTFVPMVVSAFFLVLLQLVITKKVKQGRRTLLALVVIVPLIIISQTFTISIIDKNNEKHLTFDAPSDLNTYQFWGTAYVGLGWNGDETGKEPSKVGVTWSDRKALEDALKHLNSDDPLDSRIESAYRDLYMEILSNKKGAVAMIYSSKFFELLKKEALLALAFIVSLVAFVRTIKTRRQKFWILLTSFGMVGVCLLEPVLSAPFVFYFGNLVAVTQVLVYVFLINYQKISSEMYENHAMVN
jgi:hypothetical protein